ncbi:hypothetical protein BM221_001185 [Beauveria bassiana]|uniref:Uncharacterized protein n=1 Tax=Beauveria bassiana TaxID=176275 RepID=A0A2N6P2N3_BEABA|nr:hypothetical protein BM221_001185 [Beauveria bassiana]
MYFLRWDCKGDASWMETAAVILARPPQDRLQGDATFGTDSVTCPEQGSSVVFPRYKALCDTSLAPGARWAASLSNLACGWGGSFQATV